MPLGTLERQGGPAGGRMELSPEHRLLISFASWDNPVMQQLTQAVGARTDAALTAHVGVAPTTRGNWKKGRAIEARSPERVFDSTLKAIAASALDAATKATATQIVRDFKTKYEDPNRASVYEAIELLGIDIDVYQKMIDRLYYAAAPLFPTIYSASKTDCDAHLRRYAGLYDVWLRRGDKMWMHCQLRVRYVLEMAHGHVIRCKFNLPAIDRTFSDGEPHWEYDGFLVPRPDKLRLYWMFEQRKAATNDYFHFVTDRGGVFPRNGPMTMEGRYLTTGQDFAPPIIADDILLQRRPEKLARDMERRMREEIPPIETEAECAELADRLTSYRRSRVVAEEQGEA